MTDGRRNRPQYAEPGSMARIFEAATLYGNVDTDSRSDPDFERAKARLTQAVNCRVRAAVERLLSMSSKGGRARAQKLTPERRREIAERAAAVRWTRQQSACRQARAEQAPEEVEDLSHGGREPA